MISPPALYRSKCTEVESDTHDVEQEGRIGCSFPREILVVGIANADIGKRFAQDLSGELLAPKS